MRAKIGLTVYPMSNEKHLHQLFSGFDLLAERQQAEVTFQFDGQRRFGVKPKDIYDHQAFLTMAQVADGPLLCFDLHDSAEVSQQLYDQCDIYFKRSYHRVEHGDLAKMRPLGLYLHVVRPGVHWPHVLRPVFLDRGARRVREIARALNLPGTFAASENHLSTVPLPSLEPKVLFMTRAWDPQESRTPNEDKSRDRMAISESRANCIRALRDHLGPIFIGGMEDTPFARKHYPDLVMPRNKTSKPAYLADLKNYDICISTAGLHRSTGSKFAEYLALGRAVVCEPMSFWAGEGLESGQNYLEFQTPEECVAQVSALIDDPTRRGAMMLANARYYRTHVQPDSLVLNSLFSALA